MVHHAIHTVVTWSAHPHCLPIPTIPTLSWHSSSKSSLHPFPLQEMSSVNPCNSCYTASQNKQTIICIGLYQSRHLQQMVYFMLHHAILTADVDVLIFLWLTCSIIPTAHPSQPSLPCPGTFIQVIPTSSPTSRNVFSELM